MLESRIGDTWDDIVEMQEDLECELKGEVFFGNIQSIPFSPSLQRMEISNGEESYMLDFKETEDGIELIEVN